uniref:Uncharacterized protein n=1 Tax=Ursus americanus TaxID=9643 RepID=A0A452SGU6_URSAM
LAHARGPGWAARAGSGTPRARRRAQWGGSGSAAQAPTSRGASSLKAALARVKALVKADPDVTLAGQEGQSSFSTSAVKLFVETHWQKMAYCCAQQGKRKTLQRKSLEGAFLQATLLGLLL